MIRQWVLVAPVGEEFWIWDADEGEYALKVFTPEVARLYADNTNAAIATWAEDARQVGGTPYLPPILSAHQPGGWRGGSIHAARVAEVDGRAAIYLDVEWLPSVAADIEQRHTNFVSIGTRKEYRDYRGRDLGPLIHELSITEDPRLKSLGSIQDTQGLQLSEALKQGASSTMTIEELTAQLEAALKRIDDLEKMLQQKAEIVDDIETKDGEPAADDKKPEDTAMMDGEEDPLVVELSDTIIAKAHARARQKLGEMRLGDHIPAIKPQGKLSRREQGIKLGLKGKALADYELGIESK